MGSLNLSQYQSAVLRALNNLRTTHPAVAAGDHTRCINDAAEKLVRMFPDRFPEHHETRTWSTGPTVVGDHLIALPSNLLVLQRVTHSDGATITSGDWSSTEEQIVSESDVDTIGLLNKDTDIVEYPSLWARKGTSLLYYPTTRTGKTTTFRFYGTSSETPLSAGGDTFRMDSAWDETIIYLAASKLAMIIGWSERSAELHAQALRDIGTTISVTNYESPAIVLSSAWEFDSGRSY